MEGFGELNWIQMALWAVGGICCLIVLVQDCRNRWVHVAPLVVLFVAGTAFRYVSDGLVIARELAANMLFFGVLLLISWLYMRIRHGASPFFNEQFGIGDLFFILASATWFPPLGFVLYFVTGIVLILILVVCLLLGRVIRKDWPIPLAGFLALHWILFLPMHKWLEEMVWDWMLIGA